MDWTDILENILRLAKKKLETLVINHSALVTVISPCVGALVMICVCVIWSPAVGPTLIHTLPVFIPTLFTAAPQSGSREAFFTLSSLSPVVSHLQTVIKMTLPEDDEARGWSLFPPSQDEIDSIKKARVWIISNSHSNIICLISRRSFCFWVTLDQRRHSPPPSTGLVLSSLSSSSSSVRLNIE